MKHEQKLDFLSKKEEKWKVYKTRITSKSLLLAAVPLLAALVLGHFAIDANHKFSVADPFRYFFIGIPGTISVLVLISVVVFLMRFLGRSVSVQGRKLVYKDPKKEVEFDVINMAYSPPTSGLLRSMMFSDGDTFVHFPEVFVGKESFEELQEHVRKKREKRHSSTGKTYSL